LTPKLSTEIDDLLDKVTNEKFTNGDSLEKMFDILHEIEEIETSFK